MYSINFINNTFEEFNILQNPKSEGDSSRFEGSIGRVHKEQLRTRGLIIDIYEGFPKLSVSFRENAFRNIQLYYKKKNYNGNENIHCDHILDPPDHI